MEAKRQTEKREAGATEKASNVKGELVEFAWWMKKQGYMNETIKCDVSTLKILREKEADLRFPESVKEVIAKQKLSGNRRKNVINTYTLLDIGSNNVISPDSN